jgi:hypothetical protein
VEQQASAAGTGAAAASGYKRNVDDYDYIVPTGGRHYEVPLLWSPYSENSPHPSSCRASVVRSHQLTMFTTTELNTCWGVGLCSRKADPWHAAVAQVFPQWLPLSTVLFMRV